MDEDTSYFMEVVKFPLYSDGGSLEDKQNTLACVKKLLESFEFVSSLVTLLY